MFSNSKTSGKHMIIDFKNIGNDELLNSMNGLMFMLDVICLKYQYNVLNRSYHAFDPIGCTIIYLLSESHISLHTFPEKKYIAFDIYTCKQHENNGEYLEIYNYMMDILQVKRDGQTMTTLVNRNF